MRLLLIAAAALSLALAGSAFASEQHPSQGELEAELVCPQCHEPLDESNSPIAQQMKLYIRQHIAMGWTKSRIVNSLEGPPNNLGPSILGVPRKHGFDLIAWLLPLGGIGIGALALAGGAWAWSRNKPGPLAPAAAPLLDPILERRLDDELARFDG
jgi:cytochrome c-type biogenesis protein CcmH/NrfF